MRPFSVIIITKNEEDNLPFLLSSIKNQTFLPKEIIVADADSTDKTRDIATQFGCKVVEGGLPSVGRNSGARYATTKNLVFFDADVVLDDPTFFERSWNSFHEQSLALGVADVHPKSNKIVDKLFHGAYNLYVRLVGGMQPHAPGFCMFVDKDAHDAVGGFDEKIIFCEDHEYARRIAKKGTFGFFPRSVRIPVSVRRMERDGRAKIAFKYMTAEIYFILFGPIRDNRFHYEFGHPKRKQDK